jgi:hypothetical protein
MALTTKDLAKLLSAPNAKRLFDKVSAAGLSAEEMIELSRSALWSEEKLITATVDELVATGLLLCQARKVKSAFPSPVQEAPRPGRA